MYGRDQRISGADVEWRDPGLATANPWKTVIGSPPNHVSC
jgi:hypothetical protein